LGSAAGRFLLVSLSETIFDTEYHAQNDNCQPPTRIFRPTQAASAPHVEGFSKFLFESTSMWTSIPNHLIFHSKNAELGLGGPRAFPVSVCVACVAELELGGPRGRKVGPIIGLTLCRI